MAAQIQGENLSVLTKSQVDSYLSVSLQSIV